MERNCERGCWDSKKKKLWKKKKWERNNANETQNTKQKNMKDKEKLLNKYNY